MIEPTSRPIRPGITTEPFPAATKVYVPGTLPGVRVPMREIRVQPTRTHAGAVVENPPITLYDTSGPYTDPEARIARCRRSRRSAVVVIVGGHSGWLTRLGAAAATPA